MSTVRPDTAPPPHAALTTVRRLILFLLLFSLVLIGTSGLSGLLGRLLSSGTSLAERDVGGLARSLAFALVGGTLAAILWWLVWRRLRESGERAALSWGLYVSGVYVVALITFTTALLGLASSAIGGDSPQWYSGAAAGLVWALVWAWHRWMWLHPAKGPSRLAGVPLVVGSVFGLLIGAGGAATALGNLFDAGLQGIAGTPSLGNPWWVPVLQSLVWAAGGAVLWWWHWIRGRGLHLTTGLANVALAVAGVLGGCILALSGAVAALFVLLRLGFDRSSPLPQLLEPLGPAVAAAAVGCAVWRYHAALAGRRSGAMRQASRLLAAGAALVAAASGIGVVVNAALGLAETTLAGTGTRTLLLGGITALAVGGPVWWQVWGLLHQRGPQRSGQRGQRIYLVVVFGLSAVVALIALLVVGYQAFEHLLDASGRGSLLGRVRAPLGLLTATGLVAAYHYGVWRRERTAPAQPEPVPPSGAPGEPDLRRGIGEVILVADSDPVPLCRAIREASGADVTVWERADGGAAVPGTGTAPDPGDLVRALNGVSCERVLVVIGRDGRIDVIPLADGAASLGRPLSDQ
ncbi:hypothetical protein J2809_001138 [Arthrobacter pascens]|uniref:DUF5671 domain-containing protein n=1 Tax=Arthrobacter pascens TaxID=1677 RepID=UPI002854CC4E|nr:DUF5671 domain-containing protein [Arthrobacter pascens]MDR6556796.1 hypothetical protein [Arthrobacter pascens]